ncbi:MAG TPA: NAD(P)-dependent oxidoreductase [bacterium]|jgi:UDP-glucose 4-epimerase|nr:NAD(P)-dependent oxidoreductase [bacterium]
MARPRVLLTGGSGFVGRNILESGLRDKYEFVSPGHGELDLCDSAAVDSFFRGRSFDAIVHSAVKPGHRNAKDFSALFYDNVRQFFNLERHAGEVGRMIVMGSGSVYDPKHYRPRMSEDYFGVHVPDEDAGFFRYVCEKRIEGSENIVDLRIFGLFGKYEDYAIRFISNMMCKCLAGLPLTMNQDRRFDYLYIDDLMPVLEHFLAGRPAHHAYNVTPDETASLLDLAHRILALSGKDLPIVVRTPGQGPEYSGDNARLKAEFPAFAPTPIEKSLKELYAWYAQHPELIRREELLHDK